MGRRGKDRVWLHVLLLLLTFVTTTMIGTLHYASFASNFGMRQVPLTTGLLWYGLPLQPDDPQHPRRPRDGALPRRAATTA